MSKGSKKTKSASEKQYFAAYNSVTQREKRLQRHLKNHPNDGQAAKAKPTYRRKAPFNKGGWMTHKMTKIIYMGFQPKKDENATDIMNAMPSSDQKKMAKFSAELRSARNRIAYTKKDNTKFV